MSYQTCIHMKHTRLNSEKVIWISFPFTSYSMLGFMDEVTKINRFFQIMISDYCTVLTLYQVHDGNCFFAYVCRPEPATILQGHVLQGRKQRWRKIFSENDQFLDICIYIVTLFAPLTEHTHATKWHVCRGLVTAAVK